VHALENNMRVILTSSKKEEDITKIDERNERNQDKLACASTQTHKSHKLTSSHSNIYTPMPQHTKYTGTGADGLTTYTSTADRCLRFHHNPLSSSL
jgi:hypothetical protein